MIQDNRTETARPGPSMPFRIEDCLVLPDLNRIERDGEVHQIEPRVMQVLVCLARRPNEVLSRQALFETVWADSVVCEEALTRTISELRRVFRDDTKVPRVIETIRKGGYRLIASVTPVVRVDRAPSPVETEAERGAGVGGDLPSEAVSAPASGSCDQSPGPAFPSPDAPSRGTPATPRVGPLQRVAAWSLAALVVLLLGAWGLRRAGQSGAPAPVQEAQRPLTSNSGLELFPALSPNGSMVAFSWEGREGGAADSLDLYVMRLPDGPAVRLTDLPGSECYPCWSPDGAEIAFSCDGLRGNQLCTVSILGGEVRRLAELDAQVSGLDWSPDGRSLVCSVPDAARTNPRIRLLDLKHGSWRDVTHPTPGSQGDIAPACSPDGRSVAFIRLNDRQEKNACWVPLEGGEARPVALGGRRVSGVDWLSSEALVVSASSRLDYGLWRVARTAGRATALAIPGGRIQRLSSAAGSRRLAFEKISFAQSIRCVELTPTEARRRTDPLIASTQRDSEPVYSPDGRFIAFVSDRSGTPEVWIADANGAEPRRLTDQGGTHLIRPRWSPDGKEIAFTSVVDGQTSVCAVDVGSRFTRPLLSAGPFTLGVWSRRDGDLYYGVETPAGNEVWRARADGTEPTRIGEAGYEILGEVPEGRGLYCARSADQSIWLVPFDGSEATPVVPTGRCGDWQEITIAEGGFYFTRRGRTSSTLGFHSLATGRADSLATIEWYAASLALSPDRSRLLYDSIGRIEIDLMLTEVAD